MGKRLIFFNISEGRDYCQLIGYYLPMQSLLLTGNTKQGRKAAAQNIAKAQSSQFDQVWLDAQEARGIAAVREVLAKVSRKPFQSQILTAIILEAGNLTPEAQNSLLKNLEEPSETVQFILTSPSRDSVLPTIASRCTEVVIKEISTSEKVQIKHESDLSFSQKLNSVEKTNFDEQLTFWQEVLLKKAEDPNSSAVSLKKLHRYNKTLLKLKKAESFSVNKKLLSLIAALQAPEKP